MKGTMTWHYESDGEDHNKTHYVFAENQNGKNLKETFLRIDVENQRLALKLCNFLNFLENSGLKYRVESLNKKAFGIL